MMELITRTARLVPYAKRPKQVPSFVTAQIFEPPLDPDSDTNLGNLFLVIEVLVSGRPGEDIAKIITSTFEGVYYANDAPFTSSLDRFEAAIRATNDSLTESVNQGNAAWIGKLSAVIAVQAGPQLHLTHTGSTEAYLYRHHANTNITGPSNPRPAGPTKTFGLVASGELESGDRLLMATPALVHQLALPKLHETILNNSPNAAIAELTELLHGSDTSRIGALIIDVTTPELAALQVQSDQPSDILIGTPETALEVAQIMAAPITAATIETSKRATRAARTSWGSTRPRLQRAGLAAAKVSRTVLSGQRLARRSLFGLVIGIGIIIAVVWHTSSTHASHELLDRFEQTYSAYQSATKLTGEPERQALSAVSKNLKQLDTGSNTSRLSRTLATTHLPAGFPESTAELRGLISNKLDELDGLTIVTSTTVAKFDAYKGAKPALLEDVNGTLYAIDNTNKSLFVVNKSTNSVKQSLLPDKIGHIIAVTASSANDGIFLLTDKPDIWFYRFTGGTTSEVSVGLNTWEAASSLASYGGNLYLLNNTSVIKHVRTLTGFAAGTNYLGGATTVPVPSVICVDGYVYLAGNDGLYQYYGGVVKGNVPAPNGLSHLTTLRASDNGNLVGTDSVSGRIGVWNDSAAFKYVAQYRINGINTLADAVYDTDAHTYYALADSRVVSFKPTH